MIKGIMNWKIFRRTRECHNLRFCPMKAMGILRQESGPPDWK
jgi:hypothetical protein